jgi:hypothetical protein
MATREFRGVLWLENGSLKGSACRLNNEAFVFFQTTLLDSSKCRPKPPKQTKIDTP